MTVVSPNETNKQKQKNTSLAWTAMLRSFLLDDTVKKEY